MAETSQAARPRGGRVRAQRADLLYLLYRTVPPMSSETVVNRLAFILSDRRADGRYVPTPSGVRTRLAELCAIGLVRVVDEDGRTASGNRCRRYGITDDGQKLYLSADEGKSAWTPSLLADLIDARWTAYQANLAAPARLRAEVQPALYGKRVAVSLVTPAGSQHAGWLDALPADAAELIAQLINGER